MATVSPTYQRVCRRTLGCALVRCDTERAQQTKVATPDGRGGSLAMPPSSLEGVHAAYCALAAAIAKNNTLIRDRYPDTHALYLRCEKSYFGIFWDKACQARRAQSALPLQLHICMDAAETACRVSGEEHDALARRLKEVIEQARRTMASRPRRNRRGDIIWPKTLPFASITLPETIACKARAFFAAVYATSCRDRPAMQAQERAFWARHKRLCAAVASAKRDRDDFCHVLMCLRRRLPFELSNRVLCMAV